MDNSKSRVMVDHLSKYSDGTCKRICQQYRSPTSRYENNQKRCKMCEIFITLEGTKNVEGLYCKCCNYRVSGVPSKGTYKENYRNQSQDQTTQNKPTAFRNAHEPWIDTNQDYSNIDDENSNEKKSTPVYEEIDESVKTFYEFKDFLDTIQLQSNYQLVMLKELVEYGVNHKGQIAESLAYFNNKDTTDFNTVKYYLTVPVYDVLLNHGFVITTDTIWKYPFYKLNVNLNGSQNIAILEIIVSKLNEYNKLHEIPENDHSFSDNRDNFDWDDTRN